MEKQPAAGYQRADEQAATAQLTPLAEATLGVKAVALQLRSGTCSIFMLFTS